MTRPRPATRVRPYRTVVAVLAGLLIQFTAAGAAGGASPGPSGRTVITRAEITEAGATRLTDILGLVDHWVVGTADGYTFKVSPNGLTAWQTQRWLVLVDGQRLDVDAFDAVNLNAVPLAVDQVDSVVVIDTPQLRDGFFADAGLIHFHTRPAPPGHTLRATVSGGNETGDPGPWRFTEYRTPNVDSMGPDGAVTWSLGRRRWNLRTSATYQIHYFTDFAIQRRTFDILAPRAAPPGPDRVAAGVLDIGADETRPGMDRYTLSAAAAFDGDGQRHAARVGFTRAEKYFLYSEPAGREIPMNVRYLHAGFDGGFDVRPSTTVGYRLQFTSHRLSRYENALDLDYDFDQRRTLADADVRGRVGRARYVLGAGHEVRRVETTDPLRDNPDPFTRMYGTAELDAGRRGTHRADLMVFFTGDSPGLKAGGSSTFIPRGRHRLTAQVSFSQRSFAENGSLWYWAGRGYSWPDRAGIVYTTPEQIGGGSAGTADITWACRLADGLAVDVTASYREFSDICVENRSFDYNPDSCTVSSATELETGIGGRLAGAAAGLTAAISPDLDAALHYRYMGTLSGDDPFKQLWEAVPDHRAYAEASYRPANGFSVRARIWYYSSAYWKAYEALENTTCVLDGVAPAYSPRIDSFASVDVTLRKLFWARRLAADLAVRNLLDDRIRYHPVGAVFGLTFYFQLSLALPAP